MPDPNPNPDPNTPPDPTKVNNPPPADNYTPPDIKMAEAIPPEFRDKPFFKDKTFVDVIKDHVNLQTLLGQRPAGIPKEDATDEEWGKFMGAIKPKSADEYVFPETDFSKKTPRNPEYEKALRTIMLDADIPKRQFAKVVQGIESVLGNVVAEDANKKAELAKAREVEFESLLDKTYTKDKQLVIDRTKKLMAESVDASMKEKVAAALKDISNENLFVLTAVLDGVYKKYVAEDAPPGDPNNAGGDAAALQAEAEKIMQSDVYKDFRRPGHDEAKARVQELFGQIASFRK